MSSPFSIRYRVSNASRPLTGVIHFSRRYELTTERFQVCSAVGRFLVVNERFPVRLSDSQSDQESRHFDDLLCPGASVAENGEKFHFQNFEKFSTSGFR